MIRRIALGLWAVFASLTARAAEKPTLKTRVWDVGSVKREALVWVPEGAEQTATPLVFGFHGHGGSMQNAANSFRLHQLWPEALVVYLQGLKTPGQLTDPDGMRAGWQAKLGDQDDRDLKCFDAVLKSLKTDYKVDEKRIYSTGHSNGGGFTFLLWANRGEVFAAVAPSAAIPAKGNWSGFQPKPVLHLAGENDRLVKFEWQKLSIEAARKLNGCESAGKPWATAGDLKGTLYPSKTGTPLITVIHPGGHTYPKEAPELIVKFFREQAKSE